ncbi:MAG: hypothetical protein LBC71_06120 [Oscillospiraceae bacterium]|jgi:hypothetical protein|nr:hypothetical protein [Oscillospiraceae bacterium]
MKTILFLSHKYIEKHKRQCCGVVLVVAFFISALTTVMIYRESYRVTTDAVNTYLFGKDLGIVYNADLKKVKENEDLIKNSNSGITYTAYKLETAADDLNIYIGNIDEISMDLRSIRMLEGRLPDSSNEIAIEHLTLHMLNINPTIGEDVILSVIYEDIVIDRTFTLVGVIDNFIHRWQRADGSKLSVTHPPPAIVTIPDSESFIYMHIISGDYMFEYDFGGEWVSNFMNPNSSFLQEQRNHIDIFLIPIQVFFVIVMILGISGIIVFTLSERKRYLLLLRCIGLKRSTGYSIVFFQGIELIVVSIIIGSIFSILFSYLIVSLSNYFGEGMIYAFRFSSFWLAWIVSVIVILTLLFISLCMFFTKKPLDTGQKKIRKRVITKEITKSLEKMWIKSMAKAHRTQNYFVIIITAACMFVAVFGCFVTLFNNRLEYGSINTARNEDYIIHLVGGSANEEDFFIQLPRNIGVSQSSLDELYATDGLMINSAYILYSTSNFFLYKDSDYNSYFEDLVEQERFISHISVPQVNTAISLAGGNNGDVLIEPYIIGMDYKTFINTINVTNGNINKNDFISGKVIIAPNTFSVGETLTMITPILINESISVNNEGRFDFVINHIEIGATYNASNNARFILSAEYIIATDSTSRYEEIKITNLVKNDSIATDKLEGTIIRVAANSPHTRLINFFELTTRQIRDLRNNLFMNSITIFTFIFMITIAISISTYVKVRTSLRSYILARAIGANNNVIVKLLKADTHRLLSVGVMIGTALAFALSLFLLQDFFYISFFDIIVTMILVAISTYAIMYLFINIAIKRPIKLLLETNVSEQLNLQY